MNPADPKHIEIRAEHFYSWHFTPANEIQKKLTDINAKPIFLMRNIYDLVVSMYYHFANNIDHEIGRGANKHLYFSKIDKHAGIQKIITGSKDQNFRWKGLGPHLYQMECMLQFSKTYSCYLTYYEHLVNNKHETIHEISKFLNINVSENKVQKLIHSSQFDIMKTTAIKANSGSHFRVGKTDSHIDELDQQHVESIKKCLLMHAPELTNLTKDLGLNSLMQYNG